MNPKPKHCLGLLDGRDCLSIDFIEAHIIPKAFADRIRGDADNMLVSRHLDGLSQHLGWRYKWGL